MLHLLQGAALLCGLLPWAHGATVKLLTADTFQKSVLESSDIWLVEFASSEQFILEERMDGLPKKLAKAGVKVGSMDCDDQANLKFCRVYGFRGSYALSGFFEGPEPNPYTKKKVRRYQGFAGGTTPRAIEKFVSKGTPNLIPRINTTEELNEMVLDSSSNTVVVIAEKETPTMYYKTLAVRFDRYPINFVYIRSSDEELVQAFPDVTNFPAVVVYADGEATAYEEDVSERAELIAWLKDYAGEEQEAAPAKNENSDELLVKLTDLEGTEELSMSRVVAVVKDRAAEEISDWQKSVDDTDSAVEFREVRCASEDQAHALYSALCQPDAQQLPYLMALPYGFGEKRTALKNPSKITFPVSSLDAAHKKALDSIPNMVTVINSFDPPESMNQFLIEGVKSKRITVLVFSDKPTPPAALKGLAAAEARHLQVGFIPEPTDAILGNFGWSREKGVPVALGTYYSDGVREKQAQDTNWEKGPDARDGDDVGFRVLYYDPDMLGPMRFSSLRLFAGSVYQRSGLTPGGAGSSGTGADPSAKKQESVDLINSEADWQSSCPSNKMGICVIGFLNAPTDASEADAYTIDPSALTTLTNVMTSMQKESSAYHFSAGNIACLADFGAQFGVDPFNTPTIAIYSPGKGRYAVFRGSFSEPDLKQFLGQILRGAEPTHAISRPTIGDAVDCNAAPVGAAPVSDSLDDADAEDFLAEIRREEAERAAQLEKELAEEKARMAEDAKKGEKKKSTKKKKKKAAKKEL